MTPQLIHAPRIATGNTVYFKTSQVIGYARILVRGTSHCTQNHQTPFPLAIEGVARETSSSTISIGSSPLEVWFPVTVVVKLSVVALSDVPFRVALTGSLQFPIMLSHTMVLTANLHTPGTWEALKAHETDVVVVWLGQEPQDSEKASISYIRDTQLLATGLHSNTRCPCPTSAKWISHGGGSGSMDIIIIKALAIFLNHYSKIPVVKSRLLMPIVSSWSLAFTCTHFTSLPIRRGVRVTVSCEAYTFFPFTGRVCPTMSPLLHVLFSLSPFRKVSGNGKEISFPRKEQLNADPFHVIHPLSPTTPHRNVTEYPWQLHPLVVWNSWLPMVLRRQQCSYFIHDYSTLYQHVSTRTYPTPLLP